jgi:gliding-associated putative ABC transporter substrate-binding component GldG
MESKKIKNRSEFIIYILAILAFIGIGNYFASKWFKRIDMTDGKEYSISKSTKDALKNLDDIINIKVYFSKNLPPNLHTIITTVKDILSEYQAFGGKKIRITWEDPLADDKIKQEAESYGIPAVQLETYEKDKRQNLRGYLGIAVLYEDKKEALPVVQNLQNLEYDLTMAIMKVSRKSVPKVGIVKVDSIPQMPPQYQQQMPNQEETTEQKLKNVYEGLRSNFEVNTIDLSDGKPIDSSYKTIIVPGTSTLTDRKLFEIDQFLMNGGNVIVAADAVTINFQYGINAIPVESNLFNMLESYGVKVNKDLILDANCGQVSIPQQVGPFQMNVPVPYPYFVRLGKGSFDTNNPAVSQLAEVVFPWTSSLTLLVDPTKNTTKASVLAKSSNKSWQVTGNFDLNPQQQWAAPSTASLKEYTLAVAIEGTIKSYFAGKPIPQVNQSSTESALSQINLTTPSAEDANRSVKEITQNGHLVVIGDGDFISGQNAQGNNVMMMMNMVEYLSLSDNLISIRSRSIKDRTINADLLEKGSSKPNIIRIINIVAMPIIIIIIGLFIFYRRKEVIPAAPVTTTQTATEEKK